MLREQSGNMYDWVDYTFNVIKGACKHSCEYCFMKNFVKNELRFDDNALVDLGKDNFIFVGSSTDMFAKDVPTDWISAVLRHCRQYDNTYLFQTKNPDRVVDFLEQFPLKSYIGTTIETDMHNKFMGEAPEPLARAEAMYRIPFKKTVTVEPVMNFVTENVVDMIYLCRPEWVNIGADSKKNNLPEPSTEKVKELIRQLEEFTEVRLKKNLKRIYDSEAHKDVQK